MVLGVGRRSSLGLPPAQELKNKELTMDKPHEGSSPGDEREGFDLTPPDRGYELYRHKNTEFMNTKGWHGYYWARQNGADDYEVRNVPTSTGEPSVSGGVFPKAGFEEHYEKAYP
jgi:hypothetical protein